MNKINAQKSKYFPLYMDMAKLAAKQSVAVRRQVGAVIVLPSGLIGLGFNGMPAGFENECEYTHLKERITKPEVIHAERNALDKLTRQGVSADGGILFTTVAPCIECAKSIAAVGITNVFYDENYHCDSGINFLKKAGVKIFGFNKKENE